MERKVCRHSCLLIPLSGPSVGAYFVPFSPRTFSCFCLILLCHLCGTPVPVRWKPGRRATRKCQLPEMDPSQLGASGGREISRTSVPKDSECVGRQCFCFKKTEESLTYKYGRHIRNVILPSGPFPTHGGDVQGAAGGPSLRITVERP